LSLVNTQRVSMSGSPTPIARRALAARLTWLADRADMADAAERRHERIAPGNSLSRLALVEGVVLARKVLDVSVSGGCIKTPARPQIGTEVMLGKLRARDAPLSAAIHRHSEPGRARPPV
jgi:hypothetical protein